MAGIARAWKESLVTALNREQVIGDVLRKGWQPRVELKVSFPTSKYDVEKTGLSLTPSETAKQPEIQYEAENDKLYTLMMVDPDPPSRKEPKYRHWRHWIRVNVPGDRVEQGTDVSPYIGPGRLSFLWTLYLHLFASFPSIHPSILVCQCFLVLYTLPSTGPPPKTGLHRYVFLLYQQQNKIEHDFWGNDGMDGKEFDFEKWAKEQNLDEPLGAWYFQAQNEQEP